MKVANAKLALALVLVLTACGKAETGPAGGFDAGSTPDAGAGSDAGTTDAGDAGSGLDAGSAPDAGSASDGGFSPDGGFTAVPLDPAVIHAVLDAADTALSGIVAATTDHAVRNQQMAAWLLTRPEFAEAHVTGFDSVWGRLVNGHLYVATTAFNPLEDPPLPAGALPARPASPRTNPLPFRQAQGQPVQTQAADPTLELPAGTQARVLLSLDPAFYNPPNSSIAGYLRDRNYNVLEQSATVENLKTVQGDGFFYWGSHGTLFPLTGGGNFWAVWTATDVTDADNLANKPDLDDFSLVYFTAAYKTDAQNHLLLKTRYAITRNFIVKYSWSFAAHSFLFMNSCWSDAGILDSFAARPGPVDLTYGWNNTVLVSSAWRAGQYAADRLLGANQDSPKENLPQRPFGGAKVWFDMQQRHFDDGGGATRLIARGPGDPSLAPSIEKMDMKERVGESPLVGKTTLTLHGQFGSVQGTVKVDGVEVPIQSWATDKVEAEPADVPGPGFSGDVQVFVDDRKSNAVPLTQWHGTTKYTIDLLPPIAADAVTHIDCDLYFRADVHGSRSDPGIAPVSPSAVPFRAAQTSKCHWNVTGNPPPPLIWVAATSADLPFGLNGNVNLPYGTGFIFSGELDPNGSTAKLSFNFLGCVTAYAAPQGGPSQALATLHDTDLTSQASGVGSDGYPIYSNNLAAALDDQYIVPGRTVSGAAAFAPFQPTLVWTDFVSSHQPDDTKGEDDQAP